MQPGWLQKYFAQEDRTDDADGPPPSTDPGAPPFSRREFVKSGVVAGVAAGMAATAAPAEAQQTRNPLSNQWWPAQWGGQDQRGAITTVSSGALWKKDNATYNMGCPGPGITAARWLADKKIAVVGADTWPVEAVPGENANMPFACHAFWLTINGIYINENLDLEALAADRVYEFAWSFNPVPIKGGTGAPGNSVAIA